MAPLRLAGVMIWTTADRYESMRYFYVETLGLRPRSDRERFVNFEWDSVRLTIGVHADVRGTSADPLRVMVNLAVDDLSAFHQSLVEKHVTCLRSPGPEEWGGLVATYADPDGNTIQLMQLPD